MAKACLRVARDGGVNLFDNAEVYGTPYGEAERIMGEAISQLREEDPQKWRRSDIILTTKVWTMIYPSFDIVMRVIYVDTLLLLVRDRYSGGASASTRGVSLGSISSKASRPLSRDSRYCTVLSTDPP